MVVEFIPAYDVHFLLFGQTSFPFQLFVMHLLMPHFFAHEPGKHSKDTDRSDANS